MRRFLKQTVVVLTTMSFIGAISASEAKRDPEKSMIIDSRALIQSDFSGIETRPIVRAFVTWMNETEGDIMIMPPSDADALFFNLIMKDGDGDLRVFDMELDQDAKVPEPWAKNCRQSFYIIRVTSENAVVKALDGEDRQIMAFTFEGCVFKFIAVVADRMQDEEMMYTTMLHELGHMWGLKDNTRGKDSIMNGSWPGSKCITKHDLQDVYDVHHKHGMAPPKSGCGK